MSHLARAGTTKEPREWNETRWPTKKPANIGENNTKEVLKREKHNHRTRKCQRYNAHEKTTLNKC
jgi:hypothetical protein